MLDFSGELAYVERTDRRTTCPFGDPGDDFNDGFDGLYGISNTQRGLYVTLCLASCTQRHNRRCHNQMRLLRLEDLLVSFRDEVPPRHNS